jgi:hypothetical protein
MTADRPSESPGDTRTIRKIAAAMKGPRFLLLTAAEIADLAEAEEQIWEEFSAEWDLLTPDHYMADGGKYRLRRYSRFALDTPAQRLTQLPHRPYHQSVEVNSLNGGVERHFDPCTSSFCRSPILQRTLPKLGVAFTQANGSTIWDIRLHPYRIKASSTAVGRPAPEGRHRDGVTFVMTMMIRRHGVGGGESTLFTNSGDKLAALTLVDRGELLVSDDAETTHAVSPVYPIDAGGSGYRDVLVIAFTANGEK